MVIGIYDTMSDGYIEFEFEIKKGEKEEKYIMLKINNYIKIFASSLVLSPFFAIDLQISDRSAI